MMMMMISYCASPVQPDKLSNHEGRGFPAKVIKTFNEVRSFVTSLLCTFREIGTHTFCCGRCASH